MSDEQTEGWRDALNAAFDEAEKEAAPDPEPAAASSPDPAPAPSEPESDASQGTPASPTDAGEVDPSPGDQTAEGDSPSAEEPALDLPPAPQAWKPVARDAWAALPAEVREEVSRREQDVQGVMQRAAQDRRVAEQFMAAAAPYRSMFDADGSNPLRGFQQYLGTVHTLRTATVDARTNLLADLVVTYGRDMDWSRFDAALTQRMQGQQPQGQPQPQPQQGDPRFDQFLGHLAEQNAAQAVQAVEAFASEKGEDGQLLRPYYADVRESMASLIEAEAAQGRDLSLEAAYHAAVALRPDIQGLVNRKAQVQNARDQQATQADRAAASSIRSTGTGTGTSKGPQGSSIRAHLEHAFDRAEADQI